MDTDGVDNANLAPCIETPDMTCTTVAQKVVNLTAPAEAVDGMLAYPRPSSGPRPGPSSRGTI